MTFIQKRRALALLLLCATVTAGSNLEVAAQSSRSSGSPEKTRTRRLPAAERANPKIKSMLAAVSERNIENSVRKLVSFGTRNSLSSQTDPKRGIGAARDWLFDEFEKISKKANGRMTVEKQTFEQGTGPRVPTPTMMTNVVATLKGSQPASAGRMYVVSGHYDSMCSSPTDSNCDAPGANDDASGVAAVLEMARVMAPHEFDATIVFMAVPGEEQGLLGATYYAEQAKQKNLDIQAMFTNDIVGNTLGGNGVRDRRTIRVFSEGVPSNETQEQANVRRGVGGENDSRSRQLARFIKDVGARNMRGFNVMMVYRRDRYLRGGDHIPFLERGFPAIRFCEPNENYDHQHQNVRVEGGKQYGDLPEYVDFGYVAQVARLNAASLASLAEAPVAPKDAGIVTRRLTNDTDLQWAANTEPDLAGYEIVWRETSSPVWTNSRAVGKVISYTLKGLSKDNYFVGVRAIDNDGNRSPVSFPRPVR
jgi:Peptidase family M28